MPAIERLALFIHGTCPGGTASNSWVVLFNGDLELNAVMLFVSTMGSLGMLNKFFYFRSFVVFNFRCQFFSI